VLAQDRSAGESDRAGNGLPASQTAPGSHAGDKAVQLYNRAIPDTGDAPMSPQPKHPVSCEDCLEGERASLEGRSEYIGGEVFARSGASAAHNGIVTNIISELRTQMNGRPCQVYANDIKVRVAAPLTSLGCTLALVEIYDKVEFVATRGA
jgi:hypothetical protein